MEASENHLVDNASVNRIVRRADAYLHHARRLVLDQFGRESGHDQVQVIATVAAMMATLENAEIMAEAQDKLRALLERD